MAKKKEKKITISKDFMDSCLFSSWRYYIGRSTIASYYHAIDIVRFFLEYPDVFSEERKIFMGQDIRTMINEKLHWNDHTSVEDSIYPNSGDGLSYLVQGVKEYFGDEEYDDKKLKDMKFDVNCITGEVIWKKLEKESYDFYLSSMITDYITWIRLAGFLKPTHMITYEYKGETKTVPGFMQPSIDRSVTDGKMKVTIGINWCTVDAVSHNPSATNYIAPEYIKEIKKINY